MNLKKINSFIGDNMQNIIKDKFRNLYDYQSEIENNFEHKVFKFEKLKKEGYKEALCEYLRKNGYGYAYKSILELGNNDNIKIGYYLFTSGLIDDIKVEMTIASLDKYKVSDKEYKIKYKETEGLKLNIRILYRTNIPIKIETLDVGQNDFLDYKIQKNYISLNIDIKENTKINCTEKIIIYRSYGIDTFDLNIECQENKKKYKNLYDFSDYLLLCQDYKETAFEIYKEREFCKWLEDVEYIQFINYKKANKLSKETEYSSFYLFCLMNGIEINKHEINIEKTQEDQVGVIIETENNEESINENEGKVSDNDKNNISEDKGIKEDKSVNIVDTSSKPQGTEVIRPKGDDEPYDEGGDMTTKEKFLKKIKEILGKFGRKSKRK
ncbi:MAG: hypothetical protein SPD90_13745 [Intestinibacter sp.]|uniref:hypothetical protein n=1 Tax=Intestinibacter sp. TaxID=1965304 RepID=UPI002A81C419|nr:hypothetical protein [Intestinibacter sp.]MDY4576107.1 hypothetical protein [Intestinibacter sp.]